MHATFLFTRRIRRRQLGDLGVRRHRPLVGLVAMLLVATAAVSCSSKSSSSTDSAKKISSAEDQYHAKFGTYGSIEELVSNKFLDAPPSDTDVILTNGPDGKPKAAF